MSEMLLRITTHDRWRGGFCAGLVIEGEHVTRTAPILGYMHGWHRTVVRRYCAKRCWELETFKQRKTP